MACVTLQLVYTTSIVLVVGGVVVIIVPSVLSQALCYFVCATLSTVVMVTYHKSSGFMMHGTTNIKNLSLIFKFIQPTDGAHMSRHNEDIS